MKRQQQPNQCIERGGGSVLRAVTFRETCRSRRNRRGGSVTLEFILAFPILFIATLAIFEFGILMLVEQAVVTAAIEGSREGAKLGATTDCVAKKVQSILGVHCIEFDTMMAQPDSGEARVIVEDGSGLISGERGNLSISCTPEGPAPTSTQIRVTVCVPVTDISGCKPVPDWLSYFGFSLQNKVFRVSSVANLE
ncbi:MAG: pilus assembly protein [Planctomycetes bacterium]|nr:pilus assembly protein [Planctomycetota bacterium]